MSEMKADYSPAYCRTAANAANALAVGARTAREKRHWRAVEQRWLDRIKEKASVATR